MMTAPPAFADCLGSVAREVLSVKVTKCETAAEHVARARETLADQMRRSIVDRIRPTERALLIEGFLTRREIVLTDDEERAMPTPYSGARTYRWLFAGTDRTCSDIAGSRIRVYAVLPCCDVRPSTDFACFFDVGYVQELPKALAEAAREDGEN